MTNEKLSGFSNEWEDIYFDNVHMSIWPWSELVSYVSRYGKDIKNYNTVLEIGCGAGANIPFFLNRKNEYYGIDGSKIIIDQLKKKFPNIETNLISCEQRGKS